MVNGIKPVNYQPISGPKYNPSEPTKGYVSFGNEQAADVQDLQKTADDLKQTIREQDSKPVADFLKLVLAGVVGVIGFKTFKVSAKEAEKYLVDKAKEIQPKVQETIQNAKIDKGVEAVKNAATDAYKVTSEKAKTLLGSLSEKLASFTDKQIANLEKKAATSKFATLTLKIYNKFEAFKRLMSIKFSKIKATFVNSKTVNNTKAAANKIAEKAQSVTGQKVVNSVETTGAAVVGAESAIVTLNELNEDQEDK